MTENIHTIRVLIVGGTAVLRMTIKDILSYDAGISIAGLASDSNYALRRLNETPPDVVLVDAEMSDADGSSLLKNIATHYDIPVIAVASAKCVDIGSIEKLQKQNDYPIYCRPQTVDAENLGEQVSTLCGAVRQAVGISASEQDDTVDASNGLGSRIETRLNAHKLSEPPKKLTADVILPFQQPGLPAVKTDHIVCIGASTGGTETLRELLKALPVSAPGAVIVQHMPKFFTASFARHLDNQCEVHVQEAADGDAVQRGCVLIAPGDSHLLLCRSGNRYFVRLVDGPAVSRHRPSVDVLFRSAAQEAGANAIGILLTGMGDDGATGLLEMKLAGAHTIAQDEKTSIVFGMPKVAIQKGAAVRILPIEKIAPEILAADQR